jgi:AmmeMemoRadiSam system protein B
VTPVNHNGQTLICLGDPDGFIEEQMVLSPPAFFIASHLDGNNDVTDIQYAFVKQFGGKLLMSDDVHKVVQYLDEHGFLLSDRFLAIRAQVEETFARTRVRQAYCAGKSYPGEEGALRELINGLFSKAGGPGELPRAQGEEGMSARCLIVPHIDLGRGGTAYAHGYWQLSRHARPETVLIFGVAHAACPAPFTLTRKHFATPLGVVETDHGIVERLAGACAWNPFEHEIAHRTEHSIEFQALMLAYLWGSAVRIVPILCNSFTPGSDQPSPDTIEPVQAFLRACREVVTGTEKAVTVIAGADLAHVGPRFGDPFDVDASVLERIEARDREDLAHVAARDAQGWYASVMRDQNQRRVCGLNCIYAALKTVEGLAERGEMLHYGYGADPAGGVVSFVSVLLS